MAQAAGASKVTARRNSQSSESRRRSNSKSGKLRKNSTTKKFDEKENASIEESNISSLGEDEFEQEDENGSQSRRESHVPAVMPVFPSLKDPKLHNDLPSWVKWLMATRCGDWLADLSIEERGKRRLAVALVIWMVCCTINAIVCNIADIRRTNALLRGSKLQYNVPDIGHALIPHLEIPFLPDYFIIGLAIPTVVMILRNKHRLMILRRFFYVHGMLCLFRSFTILVTTLPDPSPRCQVVDRPLREWYEMFNPLFSETCGDLMFSGHTVVVSLLTLAWIDYGFPRKFPPARKRVWLTAIYIWSFLGLCALLAARYHYTIDIVIAAYAAQRTWRIYGYVANSPKLLKSSPLIKLLERRSSEGTMDEWVQQFGEARERVLTEMRGVQASLLKSLGSDQSQQAKASLKRANEKSGGKSARRSPSPSRRIAAKDGNLTETKQLQAKYNMSNNTENNDNDNDDDAEDENEEEAFSLSRISEWLLS